MINGFTGNYRFLSNFYHAPVVVSGISYLNNEAAFHAAKVLDPKQRAIFSTLNPSDAKRQGRRVKLRADWDIVSIEIMELCLRVKFMTYPELAKKLVETGDQELVEFNNWGDQKWGKTAQGGKNILGQLLMLIRTDLQGDK